MLSYKCLCIACILIYSFLEEDFWLFLCLFLVVLGLGCCVQAFCSCREQGPLFLAVQGLLIVGAFPVAEHRKETYALLGFSSCAGRPGGCANTGWVPSGVWDRPRPGTYLRTLHWQSDSYPLYHQGSPLTYRLCVLGTDLLSDYDLQKFEFLFVFLMVSSEMHVSFTLTMFILSILPVWFVPVSCLRHHCLIQDLYPCFF